MSALVEKFTTATSRKGGGLNPPPVPQVNLLPSSVGDAKRDARMHRMLLAGVGGVVVLAAIFYFFAVMAESNAQEELDAANVTTSELTKEKVSLAYVPVVIDQYTTSLIVQTVGMAGEVNWKNYVGAVTAVLPPNTAITKINALADGMGTGLPENTNSLAGPRVATITFTTRTATPPDTAQWLIALKSVQGFQDVLFSDYKLIDVDGNAVYEMISTVELDYTSLSNRFIPADQAAAQAEEATS